MGSPAFADEFGGLGRLGSMPTACRDHWYMACLVYITTVPQPNSDYTGLHSFSPRPQYVASQSLAPSSRYWPALCLLLLQLITFLKLFLSPSSPSSIEQLPVCPPVVTAAADYIISATSQLQTTTGLLFIRHCCSWLYSVLAPTVAINQTKWSTTPACPSLICFKEKSRDN